MATTIPTRHFPSETSGRLAAAVLSVVLTTAVTVLLCSLVLVSQRLSHRHVGDAPRPAPAPAVVHPGAVLP
ncbi:hypothetical protein acdb102_35950 [Acidothermaceae bacterium B102]|nr:hypothetical protein acdb102_35950 [Acidothermaceae bacterium B102]